MFEAAVLLRTAKMRKGHGINGVEEPANTG